VTDQDQSKMHLNKRLEAIAWGLFLIMIGGLWLLPDETVPEGTWLLGVGVIMLGLNGVRNMYGIKMSGFTHLPDLDHPLGFECCPRAVLQEKTKIITALDAKSKQFLLNIKFFYCMLFLRKFLISREKMPIVSKLVRPDNTYQKIIVWR